MRQVNYIFQNGVEGLVRLVEKARAFGILYEFRFTAESFLSLLLFPVFLNHVLLNDWTDLFGWNFSHENVVFIGAFHLIAPVQNECLHSWLNGNNSDFLSGQACENENYQSCEQEQQIDNDQHLGVAEGIDR